MEVNKDQAEVNWQYPMVHKYQAEAKKCPRIHSTPCRSASQQPNQTVQQATQSKGPNLRI